MFEFLILLFLFKDVDLDWSHSVAGDKFVVNIFPVLFTPRCISDVTYG